MAQRGAFNRRILFSKSEDKLVLASDSRSFKKVTVDRMYHATKGHRVRREYPIHNNAAGNLFLSFLPSK